MEIRLDRHGRHVAIVSIDNQPRLNAMMRQMLSELGAKHRAQAPCSGPAHQIIAKAIEVLLRLEADQIVSAQ
jgi:hypothetical protein